MTWNYGYDAQGNPKTVVDPNGNQTTMSYDSLLRRTQILRPPPVSGAASPRIGLTYNGQGDVLTVQDPRNLTTTYGPDGLSNVKTLASPDTGSSSATYDSAGNLKTKTDARGKTTTYTYDVLNRVTSISYATGTGTTFEYDGGSSPYAGSIGQLTRMTDESGVTTFGYDSLGRLTSRTLTSGGLTLVLQFTWGTTGTSTDKVTSVTYPSGAVIGYGYDAAGRVQSITASGMSVLTNATYNADNQVKGWTWGNGVAYTRTYDGYGRLSSFPLGNPNGSGAAAGVTRTLTYDNAARITGFTHSNGLGNQTMSYDGLDRLTGHVTPTKTVVYAYDATGNRTSMTIGSTMYTNAVSASSNRFSSVQLPVGGGTQTYDAAGGLLADGSTSYTYSDRGRMISATASGVTTGYQYNGLEQRISKGGASPKFYAYDDSGKNVGAYDAGLNIAYETVYLGSTPVAVLKQVGARSGQTVQLAVNNAYADQIDTVRVITRGTDEVILWRWDAAEAFGNDPPQQDPSGLGAFVFDQRMPGQVYDAETGTLQNVNRDYRAATGSYVQSDPIGLGGGVNTYAYVGANPLTYIDPQGLFCQSANGMTHCETRDGPSFTVPTPTGYPSTLDSTSIFGHQYDVRSDLKKADADCVLEKMRQHPTPGDSSAATSAGTPNNARVLGMNNAVVSYVTKDQRYGGTVVVNMTMGGSLLADGYVARYTRDGIAHTAGEGTNWRQAPRLSGSAFQDIANDLVWGRQMNEFIRECTCGR